MNNVRKTVALVDYDYIIIVELSLFLAIQRIYSPVIL